MVYASFLKATEVLVLLVKDSVSGFTPVAAAAAALAVVEEEDQGDAEH